MSMPDTELEKQAAARESLRFVRSGQVVGLGTGSTASYAIRFLGEMVGKGLAIRGVPSSVRTARLAESAGIPLTTLDHSPSIDVAIDGADEIGPNLELIKGHGGALLREKILASVARQFIVIADSTKQVPFLGKATLPVEVIPFGETITASRVASLGARVNLRKDAAGKPFVTDGGHYILDCDFGEIRNPVKIAAELDQMIGVVEHGLFLRMAGVVLIGKGAGTIELTR